MSIRFDGRVAIVTGAGNGLGLCHALGLAERGAKVVVVDFGGARDGTGGSSEAALKAVAEIESKGGEAMAHGANVSDMAQVTDMVEKTMARWGRIDILVNNAGILRDKTFAKMELSDFKAVVDVHLMGSTNCTKAVWEIMRGQNYGRIAFTSSGSGIYGNFGQSNYGAAKMGVVGLMNVLHQEGAKSNIRVNTLAPTAATRMTAELLSKEALELMTPESITPGLLWLVSEKAPSKFILSAGCGTFAEIVIEETDGVYFPEGERTPEAIEARLSEIRSAQGRKPLPGAFDQTKKLVAKAAAAKGVAVPGLT
jgi:NAD(P)-dependent dehydrogenase (short-subunit alcohol dehydrogenase family)